jgi:hypothetical protein
MCRSTRCQPDTQNAILQIVGLPPSSDAIAIGQLDGVIHAGKAANAATDLTSPAHPSAGMDAVIAQKQNGLDKKINAIP